MKPSVLFKKKSFTALLYIFFGLYTLATIFAIYNIFLLQGIEDIIRYFIIGFLVILDVGFFFLIGKVLIKQRGFKITLFLILLLIMGSVLTGVGLLINKGYSTIDKLNKDTTIFSSSIVTLANSKITKIEDLSGKKVGIIDDESHTEGFIIPNEIIKNEKLDNLKLEEYSDFISMINDLYDGKLDAIFISTNYPAMFSTIEHFANIENETRILVSREKEVTKKNSNNSPTSNKKLTDPFTMLIMGIDSTENDIKKAASANGDSVLLLTFNPNTLNTTILSIPRDTYVPIACFSGNIENKITHAGWYGEACMEKTIENFTGIDIDYYLKINFKGVVQIVNTLGKIEVDVPIAFCEQNSDREFGNKTICLKKGIQSLNGEQALALARHRKTINDFERGLNQQLVIKAMLNKMKTIRDLNQLYKLLDVMQLNVDTNLTTNQILSLYNVGKNIIAKSNEAKGQDFVSMDRLYLNGQGAMIYDERMKLVLYNYVYYRGSLDEVVNAMKINLGIKKPTIIKKFSFNINDPWKDIFIGRDNTKNLMSYPRIPNFIGKSKSYVEEWAEENNIPVNFKTINSSSSQYENNEVTAQSAPASQRIDKITNLTITVINKVVTEEETPTIDCNSKDYESDSACLMTNLIGKSYADALSFANKNKAYFTTTFIPVETEDKEYDITNAGLVTEQSVTSGTKFSTMDTLTIIYMVSE